jgi:histidine triad (HIT) family protein
MSAPAYDDQNVFAKVLRGEMPSVKVYEDDDCVAIMDVMPQADGHTLVLPKAASRNIFDIEAQDLTNAILVVQRLACAVAKAFDAPGVLINQFNGEVAGQTVFHTHFHIIPRHAGAPLKRHAGGGMADPKVLAEHAERIKEALETVRG